MIISKDQLPEASVEAGKKRGRVRASYIKNSSPVPNWFFDHLLVDEEIPPYVHLVFLYLLRRTVGWDKRSEQISYDDIRYGAGMLSRDSVTHAVALLTDCWGVFSIEPGSGRRKSKFTVGSLDMDSVLDRKMSLDEIYDTDCPTLEQLRATPCTKEVLELCEERQLFRRAQIKIDAGKHVRTPAA
jgi:hypothetical protein